MIYKDVLLQTVTVLLSFSAEFTVHMDFISLLGSCKFCKCINVNVFTCFFHTTADEHRQENQESSKSDSGGQDQQKMESKDNGNSVTKILLTVLLIQVSWAFFQTALTVLSWL